MCNTGKIADKTVITNQVAQKELQNRHLTVNSQVGDIVEHPAFGDFGPLLLPHNDNTRYYEVPLRQVGSLMPYHSHVNSKDVVEALNFLIEEVENGQTIFYDFYSEEAKRKDPKKRYTGLFYFRGNPGAPTAILCPGGGFSYVGSLHEGFPLAMELARKGYNALVIRYRIGSGQWATEDLAAALSFLFENEKDLQLDTRDYSLWGGSAGARMVGNICMDGVAAYGGGSLPKPATAVIAYTGQSSYSGDFPPTFITVAANDGIANIHTMELRAKNLRNAGVEVAYQPYETAGHGFGLGTGTDAEGWLDAALHFWERHITP